MKLLLSAFFTLRLTCLWGQHTISEVRLSDSLLRKHVYFLASDSLKGRQTGTASQREAALYCSQTFTRNHLRPVFRPTPNRTSFRQTYAFTLEQYRRFGGSFNSVKALSTISRFELIEWPKTVRDSVKALFGQNVAGLHLGTDLANEVIVVSAHYDHLGRHDRTIYPGANDNASGTAAVLAMAATLDSLAQQDIRPRRSSLLVLFSGEEGGLKRLPSAHRYG